MGDVEAQLGLDSLAERVLASGFGGEGRGSVSVDTFLHLAHCSFTRPGDEGTRVAGTIKRVGHHWHCIIG